MTSLLATLHLDDPASLKRALASLFGFAVLVLVNPFLTAKGLPTISDANIEAAAAVLTGFIVQSGMNSIQAKKNEAVAVGDAAAAHISTVAQANAAIVAAFVASQPATPAPAPVKVTP